MTDTPPPTTAPATPAALPALIAPLVPDADALEFVYHGIIRFHFPPPAPTSRSSAEPPADRIVRVRRPFLGELKLIRLSLADIQEEIGLLAYEITVEGKALQTESNELNDRLGAGAVTAEEHAEQLAGIRARDKAGARRMDDFREDKILGWWELVFNGDGQGFAGLALDEVPDRMEYPGWILDGRLPNLVLNHFRTTPSGPG